MVGTHLDRGGADRGRCWEREERASADLEGVRQEVALMTRTAYREVLARRAAVEVARAVITDTEERQRIDRARAEAGAIPPFYVQRDEAELANAQQQLTNAQRDVE